MFVQTDPLMMLLSKILMGLVVAGGIALILWPFKKLSAIHNELIAQRENCLTTLQTQGADQVKLLTKAVDVLDGVRLELGTQTGFLQALSLIPKPLRRSKK